MSFLLSSHSAYSEGTEIYATCRQPDGTMSLSSLELNDHLGNTKGSLDVNSSDFKHTSSTPYLMRQRIFEIELEQKNSTAMISRTYDLSLSIVNANGSLRFIKPSSNINESCFALVLKDSTLKALCLGSDGKYHLSSVDLDSNLGNSNGKFVKGKKSFSLGARDIELDTKSGIHLKAQLQTEGGLWVSAFFDLEANVENRNGFLRFTTTEIPARTSHFTLDYAHALATRPYSDHEREKHAKSLCTEIAAVKTSLRLCYILGGVLGSAVCSALVLAIDKLSSESEKSKMSEQTKHEREEYVAKMIQSEISRTLTNVLSTNVSAHLNEWLTIKLTALASSPGSEDDAAFKIFISAAQGGAFKISPKIELPAPAKEAVIVKPEPLPIPAIPTPVEEPIIVKPAPLPAPMIPTPVKEPLIAPPAPLPAPMTPGLVKESVIVNPTAPTPLPAPLGSSRPAEEPAITKPAPLPMPVITKSTDIGLFWWLVKPIYSVFAYAYRAIW